MKAAVLEALEKLVVREVPTPEVDDDSVLVRVEACAVCGSDIRIYRHGNPRVTPPAIMGHESAGEVVAVGKNVKKFQVGDRVAMGGDVPCGACAYCEAGIGNNCRINYALGYQFPGSFAEYVLLNPTVVNHGPVHKVPDHLPLEEAALAEPLACCLNGLELCNVRLGETLVVIGAGPLGLMLVELGRRMGATKAILVNRSRPRLDMARWINADAYVCSSEEDAVERVMDETRGLGADVILTACPSPEAQADAIRMAANRARVNYFGGLPKGQSIVPIDTNLLHYREIFVFGSHGALPRHHRQAVELLAEGAIDAGRYISHRFPLERAAEAFAAAEAHDGLRVVIKPGMS